MHLNAAYESLGYKPGSSNGARVIAALTSFGLMIKGLGASRKVKVSDTGYRLLILDVDDPERMRIIKEASTRPKLYADLVSRWPDTLRVTPRFATICCLNSG